MNDLPLPFLIFAAAADHDGRVSAREVTAFKKLLAEVSWSINPRFAELLQQCQSRYQECWRAYGRQEGFDAVGACRQRFTELTTVVGTDLSSLRQDIATLLEKLEKAAGWGRGTGADAVRAVLLRDEMPVPTETVAPAVRKQGAVPRATDCRSAALPVPCQRGKNRLRCVARYAETRDATTFLFAHVEGASFNYEPGQFVTLQLSIDGKTIRRSYTISSTPSRPHLLAITVKRVNGGLVSNWLPDHLQVGDELDARLPNGAFTWHQHPSRRVMLVSAGSGITPCMSMLRWFCDTAEDVDVVFVHGARRPDEIIYRRELEQVAAAWPQHRIVLTCSRWGAGDAWTGYRGRVDLSLISHAVPDFDERTWFVCGPGPFMEQIRQQALTAGVPEEHYHEESFGDAPGETPSESSAPPQGEAAPPPPPPTDTANSQSVEAMESFSLTILPDDCSGSASPEDPLLDCAEDAGAAVPNSCRAGACGLCRVKVVSGDVVQDDGTCLDPADREAGWVLSCSSYARSDCVIDTSS